MSDQATAIVRRFFDEMCNERKLNIADELFSVDHVYHDPQTPTGPGPDGMRQVIAAYQTSFPNAYWQVHETIVAGNDVITRWTGKGTQDEPLMGIPATGRSVNVDGIWIHRVAGNQIVESWNVWDTLGMLQQLGVIPEMAQAEAA